MFTSCSSTAGCSFNQTSELVDKIFEKIRKSSGFLTEVCKNIAGGYSVKYLGKMFQTSAKYTCLGSGTLVWVSTHEPKRFGFDSRSVRANLAISLSSIIKTAI